MRKPERFVPKARVSITLDSGVYETCRRRAEKKGYSSFSEYIEELLKRGG